GFGDKTVRLWSVQLGQFTKTLTGHSSQVLSVAWSVDGKTLASGSYDKTIRLWNVQTGQQIRTLEGHTGGAFSLSLDVTIFPDPFDQGSAG
ncbi:MAG TPA: hypothetical protein VIY29_06690, partial [Ktedonobacteraceae bacterium]